MTYFIYLLYTVINGHMVCILFKLTFVLTCPLNIRTLLMTWNVFSCLFLVNKRTPRLETILGTFLTLFPATVINKSTTVGQLVTNSLWAVFQLNLSIFADLSTEFLFTHKLVISCLIVVLIQLTSSFFTSGICNRWLRAVLYCFITKALQANLLGPCKFVFLSLCRYPICIWNKKNMYIFKLSSKFNKVHVQLHFYVHFVHVCHMLYGWSWSWSVFICQYRHLLNSRIITLKTTFV